MLVEVLDLVSRSETIGWFGVQYSDAMVAASAYPKRIMTMSTV